MDGLELIKKLRESNSNIPVVIMSGYDEFRYAQTALRYNAVDYILKPVSPEMLKNMIAEIDKRIMLSRMNDRNSKSSFLNSLLKAEIKLEICRRLVEPIRLASPEAADIIAYGISLETCCLHGLLISIPHLIALIDLHPFLECNLVGYIPSHLLLLDALNVKKQFTLPLAGM